jgi:hypothetical protein
MRTGIDMNTTENNIENRATENRSSIQNRLRVKSLPYVRTNPALPSLKANAAMTRSYYRCLRAAEMAAWELTGGDYVVSGVFTKA